MMRIALTGASGFLGRALAPVLRAEGHHVIPLVRPSARIAGRGDGAHWDPATGAIDRDALDGLDAVVHLAGENVAAGRWTRVRRERIRESRGPATGRLCRALAARPRPPQVLVSMSGANWYGDRGDEVLDAGSAPGSGFLAAVAQEWEAGTAPLVDAGARVAIVRLGMVLGGGGGALQRLLLPFRLGLGGPLGHGRQWLSWIALQDAIGVIRFLLANDGAQGVVEGCAPGPVTNREFAKTLGRALRRPAVLPAPAFALRLLLGRAMADELLLASIRVVPTRLQQLGYEFALPRLEQALAAALDGRGAGPE